MGFNWLFFGCLLLFFIRLYCFGYFFPVAITWHIRFFNFNLICSVDVNGKCVGQHIIDMTRIKYGIICQLFSNTLNNHAKFESISMCSMPKYKHQKSECFDGSQWIKFWVARQIRTTTNMPTNRTDQFMLINILVSHQCVVFMLYFSLLFVAKFILYFVFGWPFQMLSTYRIM